MTRVSGDGQTGTPSSLLPAQLTVAVHDGSGVAVAGVPVAFTVSAGAGSLSATSVLTDGSGRAAVSLTLGAQEGPTTVSAGALGAAPVTFGATAKLAPAQHLDYYVDVAAAGASDSNDGLAPALASGTKRGPLRSVGRAVALAQAGDVVHVAAGDYPEDVTLSHVATAGAPVRYVAAGATIRSIKLRNAKHVEVRGFNVVGPKTLPGSWKAMPQVVVDDPTVGPIDPGAADRQTLARRKFATYMATVDAFNGPSYSAFTAGIWVGSSSDVLVTGNTVSLHTIGIDCDYESARVTISNNVAFHCRNGIWSYAPSGTTSFSDSTIQGNHCYQNLYAGITVTSSARNVTVADNVCEYNGVHHFEVSAGSSGCTVRRNVARYGGYYSETMQYPGSSAYNFYDVGPGNVADANLAAYQLDATLNDGNGFIVDESPNGVTLTNNVAYRNQGAGISFTGTSNNSAINNTLVENGYQSASTGANGAGIRSGATSTGNVIVNNVFAGNRGCHLHTAGALSSQSVVDWNLYAPGVPAIRDTYGSSPVYADVAAARSAGREAHGISASPGFAAAAPDFALGAGSPAIDAGDATRSPLTDHTGAARLGPIDIGAFERR